MKITLINNERGERRYNRIELEAFVSQLADGTYRHQYVRDYRHEVCFAAEWQKWEGQVKAKTINRLVLLSLENLRDLATVREYKRQAATLPYTLLAFIGHDGHSLRIVCRYDTDGEPTAITQLNAYRRLHFIYSSQLGTAIDQQEPTLDLACKASYDPQPYYAPAALPIVVGTEPEESPEYRTVKEDISDYNYPEEVPGMSLRDSRTRRFHDCLDQAIAAHRGMQDDELYQLAVLEQLADGCRQMGIPQAFAARLATFIPLLGGVENRDTINTIFQTAYLRETLKTVPLKFTRPSALLTYKTEAYMREHYTLRLNVMTGTPEYRMNAVGYGFQPLDQATRNTMAINALKAGIDSWDKDLNRYIDSSLIPKYYPMEDYLQHLPKWDGHDRVEPLAQRVKTSSPQWASDFHTWMLSMVAQWTGKDRQHGNAIVPLLVGPQGSGKTTFCRRLLPEWLQTYFNDRLSMKNDNDIFIAMSSYALINIDEFDAMKQSQQPVLKYLLSKHDVKMRPPYGKVMEERQRFASFIATTNCLRPLTDPTGSRRFVCVYADEIDNEGYLQHDQLYAQLVQELREGRQYWFDDSDNERIIRQNMDFQRIDDYEKMVLLTYQPPADTPADVPFVPLRDVMDTLAARFPTFVISKNTDRELGRRLKMMGYRHKRMTKGSVYGMKEI